MIACLICRDAAIKRQQLDHGFSPLRFEQYANDLSTAVFDLSKEVSLRDYGFKSSPHLRPPKLRQSMSELPVNEISPVPFEPVQKSITGASFLGEKFKSEIAAAKAKIELAGAQITTAVADIHAAGDHGMALAKALQAEADDLKAAFGQSSNGGPH